MRNFTQAGVIGFACGFTVAVASGFIKVRRPGFLISADKKETLSKKEAAARLNDVYEDRELLFEYILGNHADFPALLQDIRLKALIDPRWGELLHRIETGE